VKPIEVSMPPALFTNADGIRYAIAGSAWVEVPADTTFDDLPKYMTYKPLEIKPVAGEKVWHIEGSKGNMYTVKLSGGAYSCTCPGFGFRRKCRHIRRLKMKNKNSFKDDIERAERNILIFSWLGVLASLAVIAQAIWGIV